MGEINVKIRIMPSSPDVNLEEIKNASKEIVEKNGGKSSNFEEEPIAFGLKALNLMFLYPEEKPLEALEEEIQKIDNINSAETIDIRRAL